MGLLLAPPLAGQARDSAIAGIRVSCPVFASGELCGFGRWPRETTLRPFFRNEYFFGSGVSAAGVVSGDAGFDWAGDTVGFLTLDLRGIVSGTDPNGIVYQYPEIPEAEFPAAASVRGPAFRVTTPGSAVVGDVDTWSLVTESFDRDLGRFPITGMLMTQRTMSFGAPRGNSDIIYVVNTLYNASSADARDYDHMNPGLARDLLQHAQLLHHSADQRGVTIPPRGYAIDSVFIGLMADPDVGSAATNYATGMLPFNLTLSYKSDFREPTWRYPADVFRPPFALAPGFAANKLIALFKNDSALGMPITNGGVFARFSVDTPVNAQQLHALLGRRFEPLRYDRVGCIVEDRDWFCTYRSNPTDVRTYMGAGGGISLDPGESVTLVHAYIFAPAMDFIVQSSVGSSLLPGIPPTGEMLLQPSNVRDVELAAGWAGATDSDGDGRISEDEVETVPGSLLWKAQLAQRFAESGFVRPEAPEAPTFQLIPGDRRVTVVWQRSRSEENGDSYFPFAADPGSRTYDPNYRQFDVEGYRVYRGRSPDDMQVIATFDYGGTSIEDFTGSFDYGSGCAPELGGEFADDTGCPVDFGAGESVVHPLSGVLVQQDRNGRFATGTGQVVVAGAADTTSLMDNGVPFAFIDSTVRYGERYYYAVSAFDYNSINSGVVSLESRGSPTVVDISRRSPNLVDAEPLVVELVGDGAPLNSELDRMSVDPSSGRMTPPTPYPNPFGNLQQFIPEIAGSFTGAVRIDSLHVAVDNCQSVNPLGVCYRIFATTEVDGVSTSLTHDIAWPVWSGFGQPRLTKVALDTLVVPVDQSAAQRWGLPESVDSPVRLSVNAMVQQYIQFSSFEGQASRRGYARLNANIGPGGSRWFSGPDESIDHPTVGGRVGSLVEMGVDTVWAPIHHTDYVLDDLDITTYAESGVMQCFGYHFAGLSREADVRITWAGDGFVALVRDLTHEVDVPFSFTAQASYGFIDDFSGDGVISWRDFDYITNVAEAQQRLGFCAAGEVAGSTSILSSQPVVLATSTDGDTRNSPPVTGSGFGLYINGERYIFETNGRHPLEGEEWTLRTYAGVISAHDELTSAPTNYHFEAAYPSPAIPGLAVRVSSQQPPSVVANTQALLDSVHTVPDPYYLTSANGERSTLRFVSLPPQAVIRIYTVGGILVDVIEHNPSDVAGEIIWDARNRAGREVATGVYFYHVETPGGLERVGRFTVVNASGVSAR